MSVRDKWVRRFSIDETTKHKNGFTIYKITSVLFPLESPEAVTVVSVWKRYSDVQRLHKSMQSLHAGLHLRGNFPTLAKSSFFKRFQQEVIDERAKSIKALLEFIAEHRLLFTSTDFVNFLQTGYPEPEPKSSVINAIRSSLHLPIEETPPLEYQTSDDETRSPSHSARSLQETPTDGAAPRAVDNPVELDVSHIPIYEAADVEIRESPKPSQKQSITDSFESISSLISVDCDFYDELNKIAIENSKPCIKSKSVLPDLINFDAPSTSKFEDYHTMPRPTNADAEAVSLNSTNCDSSVCDGDSRRTSSQLSLHSKRSTLSLSNVENKTKTEDSYIFEAGYMLNLAATCENTGDYQRAFDYYKSGIEKMLIGVQSDSNQERRAIIKEKTNKYLSYAEAIYKNHLCDADQSLLPARAEPSRAVHCALPLSMLTRPYEDLALYRVLAILGDSMMLVLHKGEQACYAMKVIQKVPSNLTEFDEYFAAGARECRAPVLPTAVPYMVPLQALVETRHLYFLLLAYAPGARLLDYVRRYRPAAPAAQVNLENVFTEPMAKKIDIENDNVDVGIDAVDSNVNIEKVKSAESDYLDSVNENVVSSGPLDTDMSVNELVRNSQKLLLNVEKVLNEVPGESGAEIKKESEIEMTKRQEVIEDVEKRTDAPCSRLLTSNVRDLIPPTTVCKWGAEILTALESLHNSGVMCRDLSPANILLGSRGQVILTYVVYWPGREMALRALRRRPERGAYVAPELRLALPDAEPDERVADYWSCGAVMYELLCGLPLSHYHRSGFTSHTILQLPEGLPVEVESLLTQLLAAAPAERLGARGVADIKRHPYFRHVDWQQVYDSWVAPD